MRYLIFFMFVLIGACQSNSSQKGQASHQNYDCKHCGMPSQDYPQWHAKIELSDKMLWFCSPRCMFSRYHQLKAGEARHIWVKDYYNLKFIDASKATFVIGSKTLGPMGADLVPFADEKSAKAFSQEHEGKQIVPFSKVTTNFVKKIAP